MGNAQCHLKKKKIFDPGAVLDRVIAGAGPEDECLLYKLANFKKGVGWKAKWLNPYPGATD